MKRDNQPEEIERRRYLRIPLEVAVQCHLIRAGRPSDPFDSHSVNFSAGGLALRGSEAVPKGETLVVSFALPKKPSPGGVKTPFGLLTQDKPRLLAMRARVIWCAKRTARQYDIGLQFLTVDESAHRPLIYFLEDYQV